MGCFRFRFPRLQGQITNQATSATPEKAHELNVLAITRRIHRLERERRKIKIRLKDSAKELRAARRELRAVLQRDSSITEGDARLDLAGRADAIDATSEK